MPFLPVLGTLWGGGGGGEDKNMNLIIHPACLITNVVPAGLYDGGVAACVLPLVDGVQATVQGLCSQH